VWYLDLMAARSSGNRVVAASLQFEAGPKSWALMNAAFDFCFICQRHRPRAFCCMIFQAARAGPFTKESRAPCARSTLLPPAPAIITERVQVKAAHS